MHLFCWYICVFVYLYILPLCICEFVQWAPFLRHTFVRLLLPTLQKSSGHALHQGIVHCCRTFQEKWWMNSDINNHFSCSCCSCCCCCCCSMETWKLNIFCSPTLFGNAFGWYRYEKTALIPQEISIGTVRYWKDSVSVSRFSGQTFQFLSPFLSNGLSFCKTGNVCGKEAGAVLLCQGGHNSNWNRTRLAFLFRLLARV